MSHHNILDYGAVGDGVTVCTKAIQRAIDLCEKNGTVIVPAGTFQRGPFFKEPYDPVFGERGQASGQRQGGGFSGHGLSL